METTNIDLTIKDTDTNEYIRIPVLPEELEYKLGDSIAETVNIVNIGNIDIITGDDLDTMGWSSFFPVRYDPGYCCHNNLLTPTEYKDKMTAWKANRTPLQVICPILGVNQTMKIRTFSFKLAGWESDIYYTIGFEQHKIIKPIQVDPNGGPIESVATITSDDREPLVEPDTGTLYTVESGDCLVLIAKKLGISDWRTNLYEPNKDVIGINPSKITPGMVLTIQSA
jgi:hypothetical protein